MYVIIGWAIKIVIAVLLLGYSIVYIEAIMSSLLGIGVQEDIHNYGIKWFLVYFGIFLAISYYLCWPIKGYAFWYAIMSILYFGTLFVCLLTPIWGAYCCGLVCLGSQYVLEDLTAALPTRLPDYWWTNDPFSWFWALFGDEKFTAIAWTLRIWFGGQWIFFIVAVIITRIILKRRNYEPRSVRAHKRSKGNSSPSYSIAAECEEA